MTLAERLRCSAVAERLAALEELIEAGSADINALQALVECLGHEGKIVQRRAAEVFAALAARGVVVKDILVANLLAPTPAQRWGAAFALSLLGVPPQETLPVLLEGLGYDDGDIRWAAASILVRMQGPAQLVDALRTLLHTGNAAQRKMAAYCLRDLDARSSVVQESLFAALDDRDPGVRMAAMASLARLATDHAAVAHRLITRLGDADEGVRRAAAATLGLLGDPAETVLIALRAAAASPDRSLRRAAERSLRLLQS